MAGFLRLTRRGDDAQLLHHAHHVPVGPALDDPALRDAVDAYPRPSESSVRRLHAHERAPVRPPGGEAGGHQDRKSTRLNSSHANISYAVFCLKKKNKTI